MAYDNLLETVEEQVIRRQRRSGKRGYAPDYEDLYDALDTYEPRRSKRRSTDDEEFEDERRDRRRESRRDRRKLWKEQWNAVSGM
ncbi:MAG: hypothetical protein HXY41_02235 [Chloroflexi bacterium]|nr:hypothetical protein [Chloroflexota bacterium]